MDECFRDLLEKEAKNIYNENPSDYIKETFINMFKSLKILDAILVKDEIGLRSCERYLINKKYIIFLGKDETTSCILVLENYYNEIDDYSAIPEKYDSVKEFLNSLL